jgi:hypothetical protein
MSPIFHIANISPPVCHIPEKNQAAATDLHISGNRQQRPGTSLIQHCHITAGW